MQRVYLNRIWQRSFPFKALIAIFQIFWDLQPLWPSSLTKPNLLRFRRSSGHVLSKTKSVTPHIFYISDITNSLSFTGKIFRKKSLLRPVYTGDFCRGNSMQFLSRQSCSFKIAHVNQVRFLVRFVAAISQGFEHV